MSKPMLQIALDTLSVDEAIKNVDQIKDYIDVIEVGTILITSQGKKAVKEISEKYKDKIIVADGKIADAGKIFGKMFFENGATFTTTICAAETSTIQTVLQVAKEYGQEKDVQVELTSHFTWEQAKEWKEIGIKQVVYHRSRDAQASGIQWTKRDVSFIKRLTKMGFKVTITGGITLQDISFFKDIDVYIFIAGRAIRDANDPKAAAKAFQEEIARCYS